MTKIALTIAYDGRLFDGWQTQPGGNTVQDYVQKAIGQIAQEPTKVVCAGRTDAGVHALAQVVHFETAAVRPMSAWVRGTNSHLPDSVAVTSARQVREDFHARFDATERQYQYLLRVAPNRDPFWAGRAGWLFRPVELELIRQAALCLVGKHDFSAFRSSQCQAASPVRTLQPVVVQGSAQLLCLTFTGNAFLHHMIRNIVGSLVYIGQGRQPVAWMAQLLAGRQRAAAAPTFDPAGLYFCGALYRADDDLPAYKRLDSAQYSPGLLKSVGKPDDTPNEN